MLAIAHLQRRGAVRLIRVLKQEGSLARGAMARLAEHPLEELQRPFGFSQIPERDEEVAGQRLVAKGRLVRGRLEHPGTSPLPAHPLQALIDLRLNPRRGGTQQCGFFDALALRQRRQRPVPHDPAQPAGLVIQQPFRLHPVPRQRDIHRDAERPRLRH